ncbi:FAD-binding protein [Litorisediminicola beolgyonensis]|uniref:FAD-binding protein n=1 Tax=Litorisediminicola beolgyonensis TaxID=1173614 RepID=A0ABW3ZCR4_9RHOB
MQQVSEQTATARHRPKTEEELAELIAGANAPFSIRGGGSQGVALAGEAVLETGGLSGITLYEPGALTLVARAGTPLSEIDVALAAESQRLAFEPMDCRALMGSDGAPTLGGMAAANLSGPRRVQVGAARDFMLGVRFVDGSGRIVKNGGRVMKNVTGYDLVKLMAGAHGTLGVLTEIALKVLPTPETQACLMIDGLSDGEAVAAMAKALSSPYEVMGAAHVPEGPGGTPVTMLRLEGFETQVSYRLDQLKALFPGAAIRVERDPDQVDTGWRRVRDLEGWAETQGDVWRLSCTPSDAPGLVEKAAPEAHLYDWGGGRVWLRLPEGTDLRARLGAFDGHATLLRGTGQPRFQPEPEAVALLTRGLRQRFDPKGLFNPGLMG